MTTAPRSILYSFRRCPYAIRARLALTIAGACYELREVELKAKPTSMLEASAKGTVPVLLLPDGLVIEESLSIMRWALERCDPEGWLSRDDAALVAANDQEFKWNLDRYKYPQRHPGDPISHRDRGMTFLRQLEERLCKNNQLAGTGRGFADAAIMPFVRQFAAVDEVWFAGQPLPQLRRWLHSHLVSDLFRAVMQRVEPWSPGDPPIVLSQFVCGTYRLDAC